MILLRGAKCNFIEKKLLKLILIYNNIKYKKNIKNKKKNLRGPLPPSDDLIFYWYSHHIQWYSFQCINVRRKFI